MVDFPAVPAPDTQAQAAVATALQATPRGLSFGGFAAPAMWWAGCQAEVPARPLQRARVIVFASDNAIAQRTFQGHGLSAYASEATAEQIAEVKDNVGPIHRLAIAADASVELVETGITSGAIDVENGLTQSDFDAAMTLGIKIADREIDAGTDLLIPADLSVANTTIAAAVMGVLTHTEPVAIVGPGSGTTDAMWKTKVAAIRDAMFRARNFATSPHELLQVIGNADLAAEAALIAQAASRRTPILISGMFTAVAAALAERLAPGTQAWCFAADVTAEPAHILALQDLSLTPLLNMDMSTGQGLGALAALPLIRSSIELVADEVASVSHALNQE